MALVKKVQFAQKGKKIEYKGKGSYDAEQLYEELTNQSKVNYNFTKEQFNQLLDAVKNGAIFKDEYGDWNVYNTALSNVRESGSGQQTPSGKESGWGYETYDRNKAKSYGIFTSKGTKELRETDAQLGDLYAFLDKAFSKVMDKEKEKERAEKAKREAAEEPKKEVPVTKTAYNGENYIGSILQTYYGNNPKWKESLSRSTSPKKALVEALSTIAIPNASKFYSNTDFTNLYATEQDFINALTKLKEAIDKDQDAAHLWDRLGFGDLATYLPEKKEIKPEGGQGDQGKKQDTNFASFLSDTYTYPSWEGQIPIYNPDYISQIKLDKANPSLINKYVKNSFLNIDDSITGLNNNQSTSELLQLLYSYAYKAFSNKQNPVITNKGNTWETSTYIVPYTFDVNTGTFLEITPSTGRIAKNSIKALPENHDLRQEYYNYWLNNIKDKEYTPIQKWTITPPQYLNYNIPSNKQGGVIKMQYGSKFFDNIITKQQEYTLQAIEKAKQEKQKEEEERTEQFRTGKTVLSNVLPKPLMERSDEGAKNASKIIGAPWAPAHVDESLLNEAQNVKLSGDDIWLLTNTATDLASTLASFIPGYGTVASAGLGVGSSISQLTYDLANNENKLSAFGNFFLNTSLDLVGLLPYLGATGKAIKIANNIRNSKNLVRALQVLGAVNVGPAFVQSFNQLIDDPSKLTVDDWRVLGGGLNLIGGIVNSNTTLKQYKRGATPDGAVVETTQGRKVVLNQDQLEQVIGAGKDAKTRTETWEKQNAKLREITGAKESDGLDVPFNRGYTPFIGREWHPFGESPVVETKLKFLEQFQPKGWNDKAVSAKRMNAYAKKVLLGDSNTTSNNTTSTGTSNTTSTSTNTSSASGVSNTTVDNATGSVVLKEGGIIKMQGGNKMGYKISKGDTTLYFKTRAERDFWLKNNDLTRQFTTDDEQYQLPDNQDYYNSTYVANNRQFNNYEDAARHGEVSEDTINQTKLWDTSDKWKEDSANWGNTVSNSNANANYHKDKKQEAVQAQEDSVYKDFNNLLKRFKAEETLTDNEGNVLLNWFSTQADIIQKNKGSQPYFIKDKEWTLKNLTPNAITLALQQRQDNVLGQHHHNPSYADIPEVTENYILNDDGTYELAGDDFNADLYTPVAQGVKSHSADTNYTSNYYKKTVETPTTEKREGRSSINEQDLKPEGNNTDYGIRQDKLIGLSRLAGTLAANSLAAKQDRKVKVPQKDFIHRQELLEGNYQARKQGELSAAEIQSKAGNRFTSDASLQLAGNLSATNQGQAYNLQAAQADSQRFFDTRHRIVDINNQDLLYNTQADDYNRSMNTDLHNYLTRSRRDEILNQAKVIDNFLMQEQQEAANAYAQTRQMDLQRNSQLMETELDAINNQYLLRLDSIEKNKDKYSPEEYEKAIKSLDTWKRDQQATILDTLSKNNRNILSYRPLVYTKSKTYGRKGIYLTPDGREVTYDKNGTPVYYEKGMPIYDKDGVQYEKAGGTIKRIHKKGGSLSANQKFILESSKDFNKALRDSLKEFYKNIRESNKKKRT